MIKTLIFDFGDVFINLDKVGALQNALNLFQLKEFSPKMIACNEAYEQGHISSEAFIAFYKNEFPNLSEPEILDAWNYILRDFPIHRLVFLKQLASDKKYQLILLSNTNAFHIKWIQERVLFYDNFKSQFDQFYLSHEIQLRKPNHSIYQFVLNQNNLNPETCLFIDDTEENILAASELGIHTWHINPETDDIVNLFNVKKDLF
ncbi:MULTISPECIES: HAD family hydrolase [Bizionia]|uniref:HAD family phosphatase n=1 Tax=Bizionia algoritergicola TaxID=291187 RepID=A0A5D0QTF7_9FLAO|nr:MULTISPECIES: HAD family phosphatase [Bizionia]OBX22779.1 haloacid dehalogenase [Bizionia sp. APA-3]TYB72450.1 HAD family phosphatase [Bizionia algoritergicola]